MAERELKGVIRLTADLSEAKEKVQEFSEEGGSPAAERFSARFGAELSRRLQSGLQGLAGRFGPMGQALGSALSGPATGGPKGPSAAVIAGSGGAGAGGGGAGVGAAAGAMGPVGIGIGAGILLAASIGIAIGSFIRGLKNLTVSVLEHARTLSGSSGKVAATMALFDVQMMLLKKRLGDDLAPELKRFTEQLVLLTREALPLLTPLFKELIAGLTDLLSLVKTQVQGTRVIVDELKKTKIYQAHRKALDDLLDKLIPGRRPSALTPKLPAGIGVEPTGTETPLTMKLPAGLGTLEEAVRENTAAVEGNTKAQEDATRVKNATPVTPVGGIASPFEAAIERERARHEKMMKDLKDKGVTLFDYGIPKDKL